MPEALFLISPVRPLCTYCYTVYARRAFSVGGTYAYVRAAVYNVVIASTKLRLDRAIIGIGTSRSRDSPTRDEKETSPHCCTQARTDASCHPRSALPDHRRRRKGAPRPRLSATAPPSQRVNEGVSISGIVHHHYWSTTLPCM
jgi:hypothetical protein